VQPTDRRRDAGALLLAGVAAALIGGVSVAREKSVPRPDDKVDTLRALQALDQRVATVAYRLARSSVDLCGDLMPATGLRVHTLDVYAGDYRKAAARAFGLDRAPAVLAVAADGPADHAGVRPDDLIVSIDGVAPVRGVDGDGLQDKAALEAQLDRAAADGHVDLKLDRAGTPVDARIDTIPVCASRVEVIADPGMNGEADGTTVQITSGFVELGTTDDELAIIVGHEMSHNILRHRARLDAEHVDRGLLKEIGRNPGLIRATEIEADRLAVYLVDRAGYSTEKAIDMWRDYQRVHGEDLLRSATHPPLKARIASMESEASRIAAAHAAGGRPMPDFVSLPLTAKRGAAPAG
jgi:hypothetical protein